MRYAREGEEEVVAVEGRKRKMMKEEETRGGRRWTLSVPQNI
jgi:hypothetical protein